MSSLTISILCLLMTLGLYFANKKIYRRLHSIWMMPLVLTPLILVLFLVITHVSYQDYMG
ncbi:MAG: LrgB family protein, partial [Hafnia sp.]